MSQKFRSLRVEGIQLISSGKSLAQSREVACLRSRRSGWLRLRAQQSVHFIWLVSGGAATSLARTLDSESWILGNGYKITSSKTLVQSSLQTQASVKKERRDSLGPASLWGTLCKAPAGPAVSE